MFHPVLPFVCIKLNIDKSLFGIDCHDYAPLQLHVCPTQRDGNKNIRKMFPALTGWDRMLNDRSSQNNWALQLESERLG